MLVGYDIAKPILNVLAIFSGVYVFVGNYKSINWKELADSCGDWHWASLVPCISRDWFIRQGASALQTAGAAGHRAFSAGTLQARAQAGAGYKKACREADRRAQCRNCALLVLAGIIHGLFVSGGPLLTGYMTKRIQDKTVFRATISTVWIFLNTLVFLEDVQAGLWVPLL